MTVERDSGASQTTDTTISGRAVILAIIAIIVVFIFLDILSWTTSRGGLFSILAAISSFNAKAPSIAIDNSGLRSIVIAVLGMICIIICARIKRLNMSGRGAGLIFGIVIIGGGFSLDIAFDQLIMNRLMISHGYSRCFAGDFVVRQGKSRVWFNDYVAKSEICSTPSKTVGPSTN